MPALHYSQGVASKPKHAHAAGASAAKSPPQKVSDEMFKMYSAIGKSDSKPSPASIPGLKLASSPPKFNSNQHKLKVVLCDYEGMPAIFYYFVSGNPDKPFDASWCEKVLREQVGKRDERIAGFGLEKPFNLWVNGAAIKNNKGYDVKVFPVRLLEPTTLKAACQLGQQICNVVNQDTNGRPEAVCPVEHSEFHPDNSRWQDVLGNEAPIGVLTGLYGNPINNPKFYAEHQPQVHACFGPDSVCPVIAGILGLPHEYIHPAHRAQPDNAAIDSANEDDPMDLEAQYGKHEPDFEEPQEVEENAEANEEVLSDNEFVVDDSEEEDEDEEYAGQDEEEEEEEEDEDEN